MFNKEGLSIFRITEVLLNAVVPALAVVYMQL